VEFISRISELEKELEEAKKKIQTLENQVASSKSVTSPNISSSQPLSPRKLEKPNRPVRRHPQLRQNQAARHSMKIQDIVQR
jgi:predicted RNase H-like nuclease (RuvC/YqgF family)